MRVDQGFHHSHKLDLKKPSCTEKLFHLTCSRLAGPTRIAGSLERPEVERSLRHCQREPKGEHERIRP